MSRLPLAVLALATCAFAQSESWPHNAGVGFKFSTLGAGVEVGAKVAPKLNLRTGFNFFQYGMTTQQQGMNFHGDLNLRSVETHADFFPFHNQFHISPGILFSSNHATASGGVPAGDHFTLNNHDFISAATDPVSGAGNVRFHTAQPMVTAGWGNLVPRSGKHWSFPFEIGAAYQGSGSVNYNLTGTACDGSGNFCRSVSDPTIQSDLNAQVTKVRNNINHYGRWFPILSSGISYRF